MTDKRIVLVTVPDAATGERIANVLLDDRLIACAQLVPGLLSLYHWDGKRCREPEVLLIMKTRADLYERLQERITALHPYQVPQIVCTAIEAGLTRYLQWIDESVQP